MREATLCVLLVATRLQRSYADITLLDSGEVLAASVYTRFIGPTRFSINTTGEIYETDMSIDFCPEGDRVGATVSHTCQFFKADSGGCTELERYVEHVEAGTSARVWVDMKFTPGCAERSWSLMDSAGKSNTKLKSNRGNDYVPYLTTRQDEVGDNRPMLLEHMKVNLWLVVWDGFAWSFFVRTLPLLVGVCLTGFGASFAKLIKSKSSRMLLMVVVAEGFSTVLNGLINVPCGWFGSSGCAKESMFVNGSMYV